jgi:hypothetical protein
MSFKARKQATFTIAELQAIIESREAWAADAHERDLHGSTAEWELTASIARQLVGMLKRTEHEP